MRIRKRNWLIFLPYWAGLALSVGLLLLVLFRWSSLDVRNNPSNITPYFVLGMFLMAMCSPLLAYVDLPVQDDLIERGNPAAAWACGGARFGLMACYAGGNIGEGPGSEVVFYCAFLATAALIMVWIVLNMATRIADTVSIDRDVAAGLRGGGFWAGSGMILGGAVAGNWVSLAATNRDFLVYGWPVLLLTGIAVLGEYLFRPGAPYAGIPFAIRGPLPAALYVAAGTICFWLAIHSGSF